VAALVWLSGAVRVQPEGVGLGGGALAPIDAPFSVAALPFVPLIVLLVVAVVVLSVVLLVRTRHRRDQGRMPDEPV
jgi:ABC-type xylose transport system permease subunit